jgi:colanic acid biosynthesis protein WcaH
MLAIEDFKTVVKNTPLLSIDFIIKNKIDNKILLGQRTNKPALGYYFTLGGRVLKDEIIENAQKRIFKNELGIELIETPRFIGVFEHFYNDSFVDDNISTHYVNLAYEIQVSYIQDLPKAQHNSYIWLSLNELINSNEVHKYVKGYFNKLNEEGN